MSALPKGWRLVPEKPTQTMCQDGQYKAQEWPRFPLRISPIYEAMIAASPQPPALGPKAPQWIALTERMPDPDEHDRVLIYTEGSDFGGEQVFDVKSETLNECMYADPEDQPEVCQAATHWTAHPINTGINQASTQEPK